MERIAVENLPDGPTVVIRVGDTLLSEADIAKETPFHPSASLLEAQSSAARALVVRELLNQRAAVLGLQSGDETIARLLERELNVPEADDADSKRYFESHRAHFCSPALVRVRHILLPAAPEDARARDTHYRLGEQLLEQLVERPERFTELAQRHSACPSKDQGGELGWVSTGQTVPELDQVLQRLPVGLHDRPLASRYGWHVLQVDERVERKLLPYEEVAWRVRQRLREEATRRALREYLLALQAEFGVEGFSLDGPTI